MAWRWLCCRGEEEEEVVVVEMDQPQSVQQLQISEHKCHLPLFEGTQIGCGTV